MSIEKQIRESLADVVEADSNDVARIADGLFAIAKAIVKLSEAVSGYNIAMNDLAQKLDRKQ